MGKKSNLIKELEQFAKTVSRQYTLNRMILFGSQAKGTTTKHSDVDLIVVSPDFRGLRWLQRSPPLHLQWDLDYPVDMLCYTPEEFKRKKKQIGIVQQAVKEGIEIKAS